MSAQVKAFKAVVAGAVLSGMFAVAGGAYWLGTIHEKQGCIPSPMTDEETLKLQIASKDGYSIETRRGKDGFCQLVIQ